jgi:hypothetical protein
VQQLEVLEDHADLTPQRRHLRGPDPRDVPACDEDLSGARLLRAEEQPQERRLARTARAGEEGELAALERERDVAQAVRPARVAQVDVVHLDHARLISWRGGEARSV